MTLLPLTDPRPDFEAFAAVVNGERAPERVHLVELLIDDEVMEELSPAIIGRAWAPDTPDTHREYLLNTVEFHYRMGYDSMPSWPEWRNLPEFHERTAADTAELSRGQRNWIEESGGIIKSWDDFERVGWDRIEFDLSGTEWLARQLPDGMRLNICNTLFEMVLERFLGYEDLFILSVENLELVKAVFDAWGAKVEAAYREAMTIDGVGGVFHADDLGFRTGTLLSPEFLREIVFPWFRKYAAIAHKAGRPYWYHCCGNVAEVMDDLIDDVRVDGFHSFQDPIVTAGDFVEIYGGRIGALGGIDMDAICRLEEPALREYVRNVLDRCMPGRFGLGTGNTVANYVPAASYLAMVEEAHRWHP